MRKVALQNAFAAKNLYINLGRFRRDFVLRVRGDQSLQQKNHATKQQKTRTENNTYQEKEDKFTRLLEYLYDQKYLLDQDDNHFSAEVLRSLHRETVLHTLWKQLALIMLLSLMITGFIYGVTFGLIML